MRYVGRSSFLEADVTMTFDKKAVIRLTAVILILVLIVVGVVVTANNWDNITAGVSGGGRFTEADMRNAWQDGFNSAGLPALVARITELEQELIDLDNAWQERYTDTVNRMQAEIDRLREEVERAQGLNEMYRQSLIAFFEQFRDFLPHLELDEFMLELYRTIEADLVGELAFLNAELATVPNLNTLQQSMFAARDVLVDRQNMLADFNIVMEVINMLIPYHTSSSGIARLFIDFPPVNINIPGQHILRPEMYAPGTVQHAVLSRLATLSGSVFRHYDANGNMLEVRTDPIISSMGLPGPVLVWVEHGSVLHIVTEVARFIADPNAIDWPYRRDWPTRNLELKTSAVQTAQTNFNSAEATHTFWANRLAVIQHQITRATDNLEYVREQIAELAGSPGGGK